MLSGAQVIAFVLLNLAVILAVARLFGAAAKKVGQPGVVGEIIAGVVLGPSLLGLISLPADFAVSLGPLDLRLLCDVWLPAGGEATLSSCLFPPQAQAVLNGIGQLALLFFMFLVGLELDLDQLLSKLKQVVIVGVGVVVVPILIGLAVGPLLFNDTFVASSDVGQLGFSLFIGAFISITALPVMVRILQEKGLATSELGVVGIASAAVVTVLMFILVSVASGISTEAPTGLLVTRVVLAFVYLAVMLVVVRPMLEKRLGLPYAERARTIGLTSAKMTWSGVDEFSPSGAGQGALTHAMFAWVLVLVFLSGWVAHILGINVIVGGFMAGLAMPARTGLIRDMTTELFDIVVTILLPVFLAFAGLNADFTQLSVAAIPGLLIFVVACIIGKWGGGAVLGKLAGLSWKESNLLGILMNCRGLLPLVVGLVGLQAGVISPTMNVAAVTMALITTGMTGPLFDRFNTPKPSTASETPAAAP